MRKINLLIASAIGIIGLLVYFLSMPTLNEDALVDIQVKAGDEKLLEDFYFSGDIYDFTSYYTVNGETTTYEGLSYLEQLDTPYSTDLGFLQKKYPEFINKLLYGNNFWDYTLLNSEKYLMTTGFTTVDDGFNINPNVILMDLLNKESGEIEEETINRDNFPRGDWYSILATHEEYPVFKFLFEAETWTNDAVGTESTLTLGEYNIETKNYSEKHLTSDMGDFYLYGNYSQVGDTQNIHLLSTVDNQTGLETISHLVNFEDGSIHPIEQTDRKYFVGDDGNLYALENEDGSLFLRQYDYSNEETLSEVELDTDLSLDLSSEYSPLITELRDGKLYIVINQVNESMREEDMKPSLFQIFDSLTGESLLSGVAEYNADGEVSDIVEGSIDQIGYTSDY